jgi:hypothetical protein
MYSINIEKFQDISSDEEKQIDDNSNMPSNDLIIEQRRHNQAEIEHKRRMNELNNKLAELKRKLNKAKLYDPYKISNNQQGIQKTRSINNITQATCNIIKDMNLSMKQFSLRHADYIVRKLPKGSEYSYNYIVNKFNDNDSARLACYLLSKKE